MFEGVAGTTAVTLTAKRTAAAAPMPAWLLSPRAASSAQQAASWIAQAPSWAAVGGSATARVAEDFQPGAHLQQRAVQGGAEPGEAAVAVAPHQRRAEQHDEEQQQRHEAEGKELLGAGVEEVGAGDDDHAEQRQGDEVEQRLRDQRAEQHGEGLAHATDPPRQRHRTGRLTEAGRQGRRHQHPDHRRRGDVAPAHRSQRQRGAHDPVPGGGAEEERERHQGAGDEDPGEVGADDAFDHLVDADLLRRQRRQPDADHAGRGEADAAGDLAPALARQGGLRVERGQPLRRARRQAVGRPYSRPMGGALERASPARAPRSPARRRRSPDRPRGARRSARRSGARPRPLPPAARARGGRAAAPRPAAADRRGGRARRRRRR